MFIENTSTGCLKLVEVHVHLIHETNVWASCAMNGNSSTISRRLTKAHIESAFLY
jgi:hypothetical protein